MPCNYNKLWKLLIDKGMKRTELIKLIGMSGSTLAKMGKNEPVNLSIMVGICELFDCELDDIFEYHKPQKKLR